MSDFREQMRPVLDQEGPRMRGLVAEYLLSTAGLDRSERLNQERRKQFFTPRFLHLDGIVRAWIITQCMMDVTRRVHDEMLAAMSDDDKILCDEGWREIVGRFLGEVREQPGFMLKSAREKWGGLELRYRCDPAGQDACRAADLEACNQSLVTCEQCGAPGLLRGKNRWHKTLCDEHARGRYDD